VFKKQSINTYALIAGLATFLALPIAADADRAADRAMKKDGFGLDSTRGNNSVAESLRQADGHPAGAPVMETGAMHDAEYDRAPAPADIPTCDTSPTGSDGRSSVNQNLCNDDIARPDMNPGVYTSHG
jgi:hypothetical protein